MDVNKINKIIGYILISPALLFLMLFLYKSLTTPYFTLSMIFTGDGNSTTSLCIGLLAIAGTNLIKDKN